MHMRLQLGLLVWVSTVALDMGMPPYDKVGISGSSDSYWFVNVKNCRLRNRYQPVDNLVRFLDT